MRPETIALVVMILSAGTSTVLLRMAILRGGTDETRFFRALFQTLLVVGGVVVLLGPAGALPPPRIGVAFAALNGAFGGIAFILFTKGLETVEASTGKPALVVGMVVTVGLGIVVLGESVSARKLLGVALAGVAVYLLSGR